MLPLGKTHLGAFNPFGEGPCEPSQKKIVGTNNAY